MTQNNICNICGANYEYKNGRWICPACGAYKPEELSNEEVTLLYNASQKLRLCDFDEAEKLYSDIVEKYPANPDGYWGLVLAKYGIKYEKDYDGKMIPTCYAASYESVSSDKNYQKALELADKNNRKYYEAQANRIEKIRKEWVEKASKEEPYDVFLSFKDSDLGNGVERTNDSYEASELYNMLTKLGYRVFFSRESLKGKAGENYEPYIFNALNTAHVMIVYGSKPEYIESTWIKNEWLRFYKRIEKGDKQKNALLVVFKGFNPSKLTQPLSRMQGLDAKRLDFSRELEAYLEKVIKSATTVLPKIDRIEIKNRKSIGKGNVAKLETIELNPNNQQRSEIKRDTVEKRVIGNYVVPKLTAKAESQINVAFAYLNNGNFFEAEREFDLFLANNPKNGKALIGKLLAKTQCKSSDELSAAALRGFSDWQLLESVLTFSEKQEGDKILKAFTDCVKESFSVNAVKRTREIYGQICAYDNESVTAMRESAADIAKGLIGKDNDCAKYFIDNYLLYENHNKEYLKTLKDVFDTAINAGEFDFAKAYLDKWLELDETSYNVNVAKLELLYKKTTFENVMKAVEADKSFNEIDEALKKLNESGAAILLRNVTVRINALISDGAYDIACLWAENFLKYKFDGREKRIRKTLEILAKNPEDDSAALVDILLSLSDLTTEEYNDYLFAFADNARKAGRFALAEKYYLKSIDIIEDIEDYEGLLKCNIGLANDKDYPKRITRISDFSIVESILSLYENDDKRYEFVSRLLGYCYAGASYTSTTKVAKTFEKLLAYIPKGFDNRLIDHLFKFARLCKSKKDYETAEKFYAIIVNYDPENHVAYWELLQAKLKCCSEEDLISQPKPIPETDEFRNALLCAGTNNAAMNHYIDVQNKQKAWIERDKKKKAAKKKRIKIYKITGAVAAVICLIAFAAVSIARYFKTESGFKFSAGQNGRSICAGKYYKAEETLVIPSESDGEPVTEIAAGAFKDHKEIKCVVIPYSVEAIGDEAFLGCVGLESVRFGDASENSAKAETARVLLSSGGENVISGGSKIKKIGNKAFFGCSSLKEIELGLKLESIGSEAFSGTAINSIVIPESVGFVGKGAFDNCYSLEKIEVGGRTEIPSDWAEGWCGNAQNKVEYSMLVTFDENCGDLNVTGKYVVFGQEYVFPVPERKGYTFIGWYRGEERLTDEQGSSLSPWDHNDGGEATAVFSANENTVFFYGNGATGGDTERQLMHTDETAALTANGYEKTGYHFIGWATSENGSAEYADAADYTMGADSVQVLYAVWEPNENLLRFDANGGTGEMADVTAKTGETIKLPANNYGRPGYGFAGWATTADGKMSFYSYSSYKMGSDPEYTLYAVWTIKEYRISYSLEGGVAEDNPYSYTVEDEITLNDPTRVGYTFAGWSGADLPEKTLQVIIPQGSYGERNYTANWQANINKVIFDANGGNGEMPAQEICTDATAKLNKNTFTASGCNFLGWAMSVDGSVVYSDESSYTMGTNSSYTLYAVWDVITYEINYNLNGGSVSGNLFKYTALTPTFTLINPTRAGYTFTGWTGTDLTEKTMQVTVTKGSVGNLSYAANWQANVNKIIFNANGGSGEEQYQSVKTDETVKLLKNVYSLSGFVFVGWALNNNDEAIYPDESDYTMGSSSEIVLYAIWRSNSDGIIYAPDGDSGNSRIVGYNGLGGDVIIPQEHDGRSVVSIHREAFNNCKQLRSIVIPETVTNIEYGAFSGCSNLESITIPFTKGKGWEKNDKTLGYIFGNIPFEDSIEIEQTYKIKLDSVNYEFESIRYYVPNSLKTIVLTNTLSEYALSGFINIENVILPDGIKTIPEGAFKNCSSLKDVISESVDTVEAAAFSGCTSLKEIYLPNATIVRGAFTDCQSVEKMTVKYGGPTYIYSPDYLPDTYYYPFALYFGRDKTSYDSYQKVDSYYFLYETYPEKESYDQAIGYIPLSLKEVVITGAIENQYSFYNCSYIERITLSNRTVLSNLFGNCTALKEVDLPQRTTIYNNAFLNCTALERINYNGTMESWHSLTKENDYDDGTNNYCICCTDGTLNKGDTATVILNKNDGSQGTINTVLNYGEINIVDQINRNGYVFLGWADENNNSLTDAEGNCYGVWIYGNDKNLYAIWELNTYTISYDLCGGSVLNDNPTTYNIETNTFTLNNPTKKGYTFVGWSGTGVSGTKTSVSIAKGSIGNKEFTANWQIVEYSISYDLNGGAVSENKSIYTIEDTFTLNNPARAGYTFTGWSGTGISDNAMTVTVAKGSEGNRSYTANWQANTNALILTDGTSTVRLTGNTDEHIRLPANTFTKENNEFKGWATTQGGEVAYYDRDLYPMGVNSSYTLYAVWEDWTGWNAISTAEEFNNIRNNLSGNYYLTNDINLGGIDWTPIGSRNGVFSGTLDGNGKTISNFVLNKATYCGDYYYGDRDWSLNFDYYMGLFYSSSGVIKNLSISGWSFGFDNIQSNNASLYGQNAYNNYRQIFAGGIVGNNAGVIENCNVYYFGEITTEITADYYVGLVVGKNAKGTIIDVTVNANIDFSGEIPSYYYAGGGSYGMKSAHYVYGKFQFGGVLGANDGQGSMTNTRSVITGSNTLTNVHNDDVHVYAIGTTGTTTINNCYYNGSYESGSSKAKLSNNLFAPFDKYINYKNDVNENYFDNVYAHEIKVLKNCDFTKAGYTFAGWALSDGGLVKYHAGDEYYIPLDKTSVTLYAVWQPNTNEIVFNANDGSGTMSNQQIQTDATAKLSANAFTKTGYHFVGWATLADGSVVYSDKADYSMGVNSSYTLYAVWEQNTNQIVFNANGGSGSMANQEGLTNSTVTLNQCMFVAPTGYYFAGWSESPDGDADYLDCSSFPVGTNSVYNLYAVWEMLPATEASYFTFTLLGDDTYEISSANGTLPSTVIIPSTYNGKAVTKIGFAAFENHTEIAQVIIPEGVTSIGSCAFEDCSSLTSVIIPESIVKIYTRAFNTSNSGNNSLKSVYFDGDIASWCNISFGEYANPLYFGHNLYIKEDGKYELVTDLVIPDTVTEIKNYAFDGCKSLTSVSIGNGVSSIERDAFLYCSNLISIVIPDSVTNIGDYAFSDCISLTSVTIGNGVTSIGYNAFRNCRSLTSINIPDSVTSIGGSAFIGCSSLTSVTIPDSVTSIGNYAFRNCRSLTSVTIPDNVTSIGIGAFEGCSSLESIVLPFVGGNAEAEVVGSTTSFGYVFGTDSYAGGVATTQYWGNVINGGYNVYYIPETLKEVTIKNGIIIQWSFQNCSNSMNVILDNGVTQIGPSAFVDCKGLNSIVIGNNVSSIESSAFNNCTGLKSVYYKGTAEEWNNITIYNNNSENAPLINATRYYYSETQPTEEGNYWHYVDGKIVVW